MDNTEIEVNGSVLYIPMELWGIILKNARRLNPRRGSSSKKRRIQKKIIKEEINRMLWEYINENRRHDN